MQQRYNNDTGLNPHLKHVNITFVLVGKTWSSTDAATVQQRSMTEPFPQTWLYYNGLNGNTCSSADASTIQQRYRTDAATHTCWYYICFSSSTRSGTDAATFQQRTRTEPALQTRQYYIWYKWKHDPAQMQQRSNNDTGRMQQLTTANIALT